jgi:S1-C subfamily serine protease
MLSTVRSIALRALFLLLGLAAVTPLTAAASRGFNQLLDAVVRIDVREVAFEDGSRRFTGGVGSGVILDAEGLILTNAHVASPRAVEISVTLANRRDAGRMGPLDRPCAPPPRSR